MFLEQVVDGLALAQHFRAVGFVGFAGQRFEFRPCDRAARVLGHGLDLLARRDLLHFDEVGQKLADRHGFVERQLRAPSLRAAQADDVVGRVAKALRDGSDERCIVARHDGEMIAGAIGRAFGQRHFDVTRRAVGRGQQFAIFEHAGAFRACGMDSGIGVLFRRRLDAVQWLRARLAVERGLQAEGFGGLRAQRCEPVLVLPVEIVARIALAARRDAHAAECCDTFVDHARHALVGRVPFLVAAAENGVANALESIGRGLVLQPGHEFRGIVRRRAVVGGAEDHQRRILVRRADAFVERGELGGEAVDLRGLGEAMSEFLGRAEVGAVEHRQRRVVRGATRGRSGRRARRRRARRRHKRWRMRAVARLARLDLDPEAVGLDRQGLFQFQLIALVIDQLVALQDHAERERGLVHGEAAADAGALAVAERLPCPRGPRLFGGRAEILRIENVGARSPHLGVAMQRADENVDGNALAQPVAADRLLIVGVNGIGGRRRPEAQALLHDLVDVGELRHLLIGGTDRGIWTEDAIDLVIGLLQNLRVLQQRIKRVGEQAARRLVAGDQEGVDLVADVDVVELRAGSTVDARQHGVEQILLAVRLAHLLAARPHEIVDHGVHEGDVVVQCRDALAHHHIFERQAALHHDGFERAHERLDEGIVVAAVERIEAVVEAAQADRVERQRRHVVHDVDVLVGIQSRPFEAELLGDVDHGGVIGLHRAPAEGREQDVVRLGPVRLGGLGGEQAVAADSAYARERTAHRLVETLLVAQFLHEFGAGDEDQRRAHDVELEDRAVFPGKAEEALDRRFRVERKRVADDGLGRRLRNAVGCLGGRHSHFLSSVAPPSAALSFCKETSIAATKGHRGVSAGPRAFRARPINQILILRSAGGASRRMAKPAISASAILRDAAEFILAPAAGRTRGRLLRMRASEFPARLFRLASKP